MSNDKCSLRNILKFLEDPAHPSVGPHLKLLTCTGLWRSNLTSTVGKLKQLLFYITIVFFFSQYIKCSIYFNPDSLKLILQYAPFHMGIVKSCFFQTNFGNWQKLIKYISFIERNQLAKDDKQHDEIIQDYINRNRRVSYFFWALAFFSNFSIFTEPYQKNEINVNGTRIYLYIFDGYTPFRREPPEYYASMAIQTVLGHIVSAYVVGWDTLVVSIMIFFAGQLRICRLYCRQTIDVADATKSHENIAKCHQFHTTLVRCIADLLKRSEAEKEKVVTSYHLIHFPFSYQNKMLSHEHSYFTPVFCEITTPIDLADSFRNQYQKLFNSLISPTMFVYLVVISVNLGVCIIQIVEIQDDLATLASSCLFVIACLIQLLLFYWYSNEVTIESDSVSYSTFESDWPEADKKIQKEIALLCLTTSKSLAFRAGPFNKMSLNTFIAILRASYSFYTLLSSTTNQKHT